MLYLLVVIMALLVVTGLISLLGLLGADLIIAGLTLLVRDLTGDGRAHSLVAAVALLIVLSMVLGDIVLVALLVISSTALLGVDGIIRNLAVALISTQSRGSGISLRDRGGHSH